MTRRLLRAAGWAVAGLAVLALPGGAGGLLIGAAAGWRWLIRETRPRLPDPLAPDQLADLTNRHQP